ncbi:SusC/RagA family TonB-linked outer membrane protein [Pontibacter harenae]|uniref:SusC/RagA family TonB-linked outer membrane protein n=1 Tax=Pontibacter harenae TaxID=2894083 RepID=UPI001E3AD67D|nr:TonB-dependent receptor [Pontibacter harenae]MCC9165791.1 TonB-dependent receptor [Pontibacter harenae]
MRNNFTISKCSLALTACFVLFSVIGANATAVKGEPLFGHGSKKSGIGVYANPAHPEFSVSAVSGLSGKLFADITVSGKVTDENGVGLPGVTVVVKGTTKGMSTDVDGNFTIVAPEDGTLVFSFVGYQPQEVPINGRATLTVSLKPDSKALEEVVVVGYGTQKRQTVTGAVSDIQSEDITRTTAVTTSGALVGKVPGITARQADARPGASTALQIRNMGTPLYVIDGIPSDEGSFNNLGINDIESISLLKDASASIYGLRASNGVVLVTTKKGKAGEKTRINLSGYYGLQNFTRYPKPANAYQYVRGLIESDQNRGFATGWTPEQLESWRVGTEPGYQSFDYYDFVIKPNVPQSYINANASGGSENIRYYLSVGHLNQEAMIEDFNFNRTNIQANIEAGLGKGLKVGAQISGRIEDRHQTGVPGMDDYFNPFLSIFTMWPTERPYANDNPNYINGEVHNVNVNPATYDENIAGYVDETWRAFRGNFFGEYDFGFGLTARATYSYTYTLGNFEGFEYTYDAYRYVPQTDSYEVWGGNPNPWRQKRRSTITENVGQIQLNYKKTIGDHNIAGLLGYEIQDREDTFLQIASNPPNNYIPQISFNDQIGLEDTWGVVARAGYIGRVNYNYKEKYLVEVLGRYDGSSLYATDKRWGFFPGVSLGWRIAEEPFMQEIAGNWLTDLKLRASYGETGLEQGINAFDYLSGTTFGVGSAVFNGNLISGVQPRGLPVTNLSWVTSISKNVGFDIGLLSNKITAQFDVFERKRSGWPAPRYDVLLPSEVGYGLPNENLNSDAHRGIEGAIIHRNSIGQVGYSIGVNATLARLFHLNTYKPRFGNSWNEYRSSIEDRWASINWGYEHIGQFQSQEEIDNYPVNIDGQGNRTLLPGDLIYKDVNDDGIINGMDERPIGYAQGALPYFAYGINGSVSYKNFTLQFDLTGAGMQSYLREWELRYPFQNNGNSPDYMLEDRWHREDPFDNTSAWVPGTYPALRKDFNNHSNYRHSTFWLTNVRYLRLRNLELGYNFPEALISKFGMSALRVYANGSNLFSLDNTKEFGIDPEVSSGNGLVYPQQRVYNFGFNLSF